MRVGVLGTGGMGNTHANKYSLMPDVELGAFDVDPDRLNDYCARHGAKALGGAEDLIAWADVVDICLPTDLHLETGLAAIAAGKAVFVEKPLARTVADCRALIEAADRASVPIMPGQVVRFFPEFETGRRLVLDGTIGKPAAARTRRGGKAPHGAGGWFKDVARSGGVLLDLAVHDFDWLRWTLGEVATVYSRSVQIVPDWLGSIETPEVGDYALTTITFESGCVAHVEATWMDPGGSRATFEVCGSEGMIEFDSRKVPTLRTTTSDSARAEAPLAPTDDPYYRQLRTFLDAVASGGTVPVDPYDGLAAVAIAQAALESARSGKAVAPER